MVDGMQHVSASLRAIQAEIEDLKSRIGKLKETIASANYDGKLAELATKQRTQEDERERLNSELRGLTLLADSRARLDLKRAEVKTKSAEAQSTYVSIRVHTLCLRSDREGRFEDINSKLKTITDEETDTTSVEVFVDHLLLFVARSAVTSDVWLLNSCTLASCRKKESHQSKLSADAKAANNQLQMAETDLSHLKSQLAEKKAESKSNIYQI